MYLHLGADCTVKKSEIIAIFNLRHPQSAIYSEYVERYRDRYKIIDVAEGDEYASVVLTKDTLYLSAISALTLKKRADAGFMAGACYTNL